MRASRRSRILCLIGLTSLLGAATASAGGKHSGINVSIDSDRGVESCGDVRVKFDHREAARAEESFTVRDGGEAFRVSLPQHSGLRVAGWDRNEFAVTACKAARSATDLEQIRVAPEGSGLSFRGPGGDEWLVYVLVKAPRNASLDLEAKNGSIYVREFSGKVVARTMNGPIGLENASGEVQLNATNGPISLERCNGKGEARAVNGPIDFTGGAGSYRIATQNGPISVELEGERWGGGGLEASAVNGPVSLTIPDAYRSGVLLEMHGHGPVTCPEAACRAARKTWDEDSRRIEFGDSGDPVVRLSTKNGPVSVQAKN